MVGREMPINKPELNPTIATTTIGPVTETTAAFTQKKRNGSILQAAIPTTGTPETATHPVSS